MQRIVSLLGVAALAATPLGAQSLRLQPELQLEGRVFAEEPQFAGQEEGPQGAATLTGTARWISEDRNWIGMVEPHLRFDSLDAERSTVDLRQANLTWRGDDLQVTGGFAQIFWGVAEARNVVDVINQIDNVGSPTGEEKLGQPLLRLSSRTDLGNFELYLLPYFRERQYPGEEGRLRTNPRVDTDAARYGRDGNETAGDVALRFVEQFDAFDLGLSAFHGTSRDPVLAFEAGRLVPLYPELNQVGLDAVRVAGPWLFKLEVAAGEVGGEGFTAAVGGLEYTFFDLQGEGRDLGLIAEWLTDDRGGANQPGTVFDEDLFLGARLTLNDFADTEVLFGGILDPASEAVQASAEVQRRIDDKTLLELEARLFEAGDDPLVSAFDADSFGTLRITRFF